MSDEYTFVDTFPAPQPLQWQHLINSLISSFLPSHVQPNKYLQIWWGVQQDRQEPNAAFLPQVIHLIETVTGCAVQMWSRGDRETLCNLFHKGLWDLEAVYMDRYFPREVLLGMLSKEELVDKARYLDQNHVPSGRSHSNKFHPWRQLLVSCQDHFEDWGGSYDEGRARDGQLPRNRRADKSRGTPVRQEWSAHHIAEEPVVEGGEQDGADVGQQDRQRVVQ